MLKILCTIFLLLCGPALATPDWNITKNIQYGMSVQETADLYLLKKGINPLIILIHGGGWMGGDKSAYDNLVNRYGDAGFSVMTINYRLSSTDPASHWNVQLQDAQAAVRWIRASAQSNPGLHIDPLRIGAVGDSAGAHLALFLGSLDYTYVNLNPAAKDRSQQYKGVSPKVQAVGDLFGPSDLTAPEMDNLLRTGTSFLGGATFDSDPELVKSASPLLFFSGKTSPTCILHGTNDTLVPLGQSVAVANKLQKLGIPYKWFTYDGGHGFENLSVAKTNSLNDNIIKCMAGFLGPDPRNAGGGWFR